MRARPILLASGLGLTLLLTGCSPMLVVDAAPHPEDPVCAEVMLRLPEDIDGLADRDTSAQATEAWGEPAAAILRCGMEPPAPTTDACVNVDGVDWISTQEDAKSWKFVTYGRTPAVEVIVAPDKISGATVLSSVSPSVSVIEQTNSCVGAEDLDDNGVPTDDGVEG